MSEKRPSISRKLLRIRKRAKQKKPEFLRSESWRYSKMSESWRRPRGLDHKMRRKIKGWPPMVSAGYKGPKIARGLHPSGLREVIVHNANEVAEVDPKVQAVRIAHTVGGRKRALILAEAKNRKVTVLNIGVVEAGEEGEAPEEAEETVPESDESKEMKPEKPKRKLFGRKKSTEGDLSRPQKEAVAKARKVRRNTKSKKEVKEQ